MTIASRFDFGDVLLVPFPFTDQSGTKKRPAVVVSIVDYNTSRRDIVIMAITSQVRAPLGYCEAMVDDWRGAGLIKASVLKPVFSTIEQGLVMRVIRVMGHLSAADLQTLQRLLRNVIG
jgi:mRNA interferase MazF